MSNVRDPLQNMPLVFRCRDRSHLDLRISCSRRDENNQLIGRKSSKIGLRTCRCASLDALFVGDPRVGRINAERRRKGNHVILFLDENTA